MLKQVMQTATTGLQRVKISKPTKMNFFFYTDNLTMEDYYRVF
jgi:hypothetical protein